MNTTQLRDRLKEVQKNLQSTPLEPSKEPKVIKERISPQTEYEIVKAMVQ